jgi:hypothetical protein
MPRLWLGCCWWSVATLGYTVGLLHQVQASHTFDMGLYATLNTQLATCWQTLKPLTLDPAYNPTPHRA